MKKKRIAIIGAGVSGCFLAHLINRRNAVSVTLFDKSRGIGGRCAVRRDPSFGVFNIGAQFFTNKNNLLLSFFLDLEKN